jgi:hypothetical protein
MDIMVPIDLTVVDTKESSFPANDHGFLRLHRRAGQKSKVIAVQPPAGAAWVASASRYQLSDRIRPGLIYNRIICQWHSRPILDLEGITLPEPAGSGRVGTAPAWGDGGIERRSRLRTPSEAAAHEIFMTGSERFALQTLVLGRDPYVQLSR